LFFSSQAHKYVYILHPKPNIQAVIFDGFPHIYCYFLIIMLYTPPSDSFFHKSIDIFMNTFTFHIFTISYRYYKINSKYYVTFIYILLFVFVYY